MTDVALVVLDTLRADAFERHFEWIPGRTFRNAYSTSHWSGPAHASLFTGRYPGEAGTYARHRTLDFPGQVLAERLTEAGYATRMFSSNVVVSPEFGFDRGFDRFEGSYNVELALSEDAAYGWDTLLRAEQTREQYLRGFRKSLSGDWDTLPSLARGVALATGRRALDYGADQTVRTLRKTDFPDRCFQFVNLAEASTPYRPIPAYRSVDGYEMPDHPLYEVSDDEPIDAGPVQEAYDDGVRYLSDQYRGLFETLQAEFDYVFTVADHGEMFGEYGYYDHAYGVYPEEIRVPIAISGDDVPDDEREETVSLLDVHRTIADLTGVPADGRGQNLLEAPESGTYLAEYRGIPHPRQVEALRERGVSQERIRAYDDPLYGIALPDGAYGFQSPDGFHVSGRCTTVEAADRLAEHREALAVREDGEDPASASGGVVERLEHVGYV